MKKADVLKLPSMPLQSPTIPRGPFRFFDRQYMILSYTTDSAAIRQALPEPLQPDGDLVAMQWLDLPDGEGLGAYSAAAQVIPCTLNGHPCTFVSQMFVDTSSALAGGRELWGYPMKYGKAVLEVASDTLTGTLEYAGQRVATGTMVYKHDHFAPNQIATDQLFKRTQVTLKVIPGPNGRPEIAQLVGVDFTDVTVKGCWTGPARLELIPSVNAPLSDLPVKRVMGGVHAVTDLVLPYGRVLHDYLG